MSRKRKRKRKLNKLCPQPFVNDRPEITDAEINAMEASAEKNPFVDKETLSAYAEYLRNWRWNMSTWNSLQREYMGRNYGRYDNLF